ncbi:MAG: DUF4406 domain-containing protein [Treponematales bacterium]
MKPRLYLSGKITGDPNYKAKFRAAQVLLEQAGYRVGNPASLDMPEEAWKAAMRKALILMLTCDGVALLDDWRDSRGARLEISLALSMDIAVKPLSEWVVL